MLKVRKTAQARTNRHISDEAQSYAVSCIGLNKSFPLISASQKWRFLVSKSYKGPSIQALRKVNLKVPKGRILGVLGRNGAGKSTLLRVLAGVYAPTSGVVNINGYVSSLFELGGVGGRYISGHEYAERLLMMQGVYGPKLKSLIDDIRDFSELGSYFDQKIFTYSSGMAARLYFSVATAIEKEVYLIDELLSVGDEHFQAKCWRRISERLTNGASGVLVTHDWSAVIKLCEKSLILDKGEMLLEGNSDHVVASYLNLPEVDKSHAEFYLTDKVFETVTGQDMNLSIPLQVKTEGSFEFAFSIEMLRLGVGWEVMMLSNFEPIEVKVGLSAINIKVANFPLAVGDYLLNVFLRKRLSDNTVQASDTKSWTYGNGLMLRVQGERMQNTFNLPVIWDFENDMSDA